LKKLSILPCLFTLGNAACGFVATIRVASFVYSGNEQYLVDAAYMILVAMLFDAFDGKLARMAKATSDFGAQLDSLADAVSFGIAPAALVAMWNSKLLAASATETFWAQMTWFFCLAYAMAALLRLARFNVEDETEGKTHTYFTGLPTPGAGGFIASLVIFHSYIAPPARNEVVGTLYYLLGQESIVSLRTFVYTVVPLVMIILAFLMVSSRIRYVHVLNKFFRGKKTFDYFTYLIFGLVLVALVRQLAFPFIFAAYVAAGPVQSAVNYFRSKATTVEIHSKDSFVR
jgi:CDP-diacylglycerol--serine O-phosphatidyltransferase